MHAFKSDKTYRLLTANLFDRLMLSALELRISGD